VKLGLGRHEWGPKTDTYENLKQHWRGGVPLPPKEDFDQAWKAYSRASDLARKDDAASAEDKYATHYNSLRAHAWVLSKA